MYSAGRRCFPLMSKDRSYIICLVIVENRVAKEERNDVLLIISRRILLYRVYLCLSNASSLPPAPPPPSNEVEVSALIPGAGTEGSNIPRIAESSHFPRLWWGCSPGCKCGVRGGGEQSADTSAVMRWREKLSPVVIPGLSVEIETRRWLDSMVVRLG